MDPQKLAEIFEAVKVLTLRDSDMVIYRTPEALTTEEAAALYQELEARLGTSRILILERGADLGIIRPEAEPDPEPARAPHPINLPPKRGTAPGAIA